MRLQKFLSRAGVASRREGERLMSQGRVRVNGDLVTELGSRVDPRSDLVEVDGKPVHIRPPRWIMLNKPRGVVTSRRDHADRPTVYSLLDPSDRSLRYVGRLDRDTEGLLLFTNEGDLQHALLHPSSGVPRRYRTLVRGVPSPRTLERLESGVELEDGVARAHDVRFSGSRRAGRASVLSLVLKEGRKREVRRLLRAVGHPVVRLRRIGFGPLTLKGVAPGEWRALETDEIRALRHAVTSRSPAILPDRSMGRSDTP